MNDKFIASINRKVKLLKTNNEYFDRHQMVEDVLSWNVKKEFKEITDYHLAFFSLFKRNDKLHETLPRLREELLSNQDHYRHDISHGVYSMMRELRLPKDQNSKWEILYETTVLPTEQSGPIMHLYFDGWQLKNRKIYYWDEIAFNDISEDEELSIAKNKIAALGLEFDELTKIRDPFFKLEHGKLYDCKVEHKEGIENTSIIPLAVNKRKNLQFIMTDAGRLFRENPDVVREIIQMDYDYIQYDGLKEDYPSDYDELTVLCATKENRTLVDYGDAVYSGFKITDEV